MGRSIVVKSDLNKKDLEELKKKTGENTYKEAIKTAVNHYICCPYADRSRNKLEEEERSKAGRKPLYLAKIKTI